MTLVSIVSSALAAALTAGPAFGGPDFTHSVAQALGLAKDASVWRLLCLLAVVVSVVAAISANLIRAKGAEGKIISAETCLAELDGLQTLMELHQIPLAEAAKVYQSCLVKVPFIDTDTALDPPRHRTHAAHR